MRAIKIKMLHGKYYSNNLLEIDEVYITGWSNPGYYKKADIHDYLKTYPNSIQVDIYPYPNLIPKVSTRGEKYVSSTPNDSVNDNLLKLPRE